MKILTIDGNNLVHRVYWVANNMGYKTEYFHVYMFLNSVKSYVELYKPDKTIMVWDEKPDYKPNKRKELLEEYKGNRDKDYNQEVHAANEVIKEMLSDIGIPSIFPREYEADDVIHIINNHMENVSKVNFYKDKQPFSHVIVTVDRDLCQLIKTTKLRKVVVYDPIRKYEINEENFEEKLKYKKEDFIKVKALQGDKSDNIPGIKGMGKVKTQKYLDGEIELTEDEKLIFEKNLKLVTLTDDKDEVKYVKEQLAECSFDTNFDNFKANCEKYKFAQILKSEKKWYNTFFQDNKLLDLLS
jgi:DNA polymerase-1|tara:strand:- start:1757 stop:2653 length:897 start_codon:yes stop_codon:yes gene_type:complete